MKHILVPIDFSDLSQFTVSVARQIAEAIGSKITYIHAVQVSGEVLLDDSGNLIDSEEFDVTILRNEMSASEIKIRAIVADEPQNSDGICTYGSPEHVVLNELENRHYDLVIMGTHGAFGLKGLILGSHTEHIAMKSAVPVLSLKSVEKDLGNIVYASSFSKPNKLPDAVVYLIKTLGKKITFLNIVAKDSEIREKEVIEGMNKLAELSGIKDFETALYASTDLESGIEEYCHAHATGLLVFESKGRTGISRWISGCVSAELVNHYDHALLTFKRD